MIGVAKGIAITFGLLVAASFTAAVGAIAADIVLEVYGEHTAKCAQ